MQRIKVQWDTEFFDKRRRTQNFVDNAKCFLCEREKGCGKTDKESNY